jgi:serpin B
MCLKMRGSENFFKALFVMTLTLAAATFVFAEAGASEGDLSREIRAAKSVNAFAFDLYRELAKAKDRDIFFSPQNVSAAFAMIFPGAEAATEREFRRVFHYDDESAADMGALHKFLNGIPPEAGTLSAANSVWPAQDLEMYASYLDLIKQYFDVEITPLDYETNPGGAKDIINNWAEEKTNGKIQNLIDELETATRMVLVSAIYFNAEWEEIFPERNTKKEPFYKIDGTEIKTDLMNKIGQELYFEAETLQAVRLFYKYDGYSMLVLLPKKRGDVENLEKSLSTDAFEEILRPENMTRNLEVNLFLPKFTVETQYEEMGKTLCAMGLKESFSSNARFPKLAKEPLTIDRVIHKAFVDVSEEGTEAAAATAVTWKMSGGFEFAPFRRQVIFRADHPFIYFILENRTNAILFMGRYMGPRERRTAMCILGVRPHQAVPFFTFCARPKEKVAVIYWIVCFLVGRVTIAVEKKLRIPETTE